ncbi:MAG: hypothetical protein Q9187_005685 [Circinaria calcarea]
MAPNLSKKRKLEDGMRGKITSSSKKARKQQNYDSSSSPSADEFNPVDLADSEASSVNGSNNANQNSKATVSATSSANSDSESDNASTSSQTSTNHARKTTKRNDPLAFSTSLNAILSSKLSTSKRSDPVLARSKTAIQASHELAESKLETKARRALRDQKRKESEKGRIKDVLLGDRVSSSIADAASKDTGMAAGEDTSGMSAAQIAAQERRLRKTAQRGVVKLFNAVRAAQVKGEEAAREARGKGLVGRGRREEKVGEMSKKGFLDLIAGGGETGKGNTKSVTVEE